MIDRLLIAILTTNHQPLTTSITPYLHWIPFLTVEDDCTLPTVYFLLKFLYHFPLS